MACLAAWANVNKSSHFAISSFSRDRVTPTKSHLHTRNPERDSERSSFALHSEYLLSSPFLIPPRIPSHIIIIVSFALSLSAVLSDFEKNPRSPVLPCRLSRSQVSGPLSIHAADGFKGIKALSGRARRDTLRGH